MGVTGVVIAAMLEGCSSGNKDDASAECGCNLCLEKNSMKDCVELFKLDCDCATTMKATTTMQATTTGAPCGCDACMKKGNSREVCESFKIDCSCVQTLAASKPVNLLS